MKFFKRSLDNLFLYDDEYDTTPIELYNYLCKYNQYTYLGITSAEENLSNEREMIIKNKLIHKNRIENKKSLDIYTNKYICRSKVTNYLMIKGKKLTAYKLYNNTFKLFYFFFEKFNNELNINYDLYNTYFKFSHKNKHTFFEPVFIFRNLVNLLQPSYIISFKKTIKKKKSKKLNKEIIINYIRPLSRINFALKSVIRFSKSFMFEKKYENVAYTLIYLFLSNKNSSLYKKKVVAYERLIKLKKVK